MCKLYTVYFWETETNIKLVRNGVSAHVTGATTEQVYREMIVMISQNYKTLPNVLEMQLYEIEFFYDNIRYLLESLTKDA